VSSNLIDLIARSSFSDPDHGPPCPRGWATESFGDRRLRTGAARAW